MSSFTLYARTILHNTTHLGSFVVCSLCVINNCEPTLEQWAAATRSKISITMGRDFLFTVTVLRKYRANLMYPAPPPKSWGVEINRRCKQRGSTTQMLGQVRQEVTWLYVSRNTAIKCHVFTRFFKNICTCFQRKRNSSIFDCLIWSR